MSFLDDLGSWVGGLFTSGDGSSDVGSGLGDAANSYYDSGGDAVAGSVGSGASDLGSSLGNLSDSMGTSPSIDSLLARIGVDNGAAGATPVGGDTAQSFYDHAGDGAPGSIGSGPPAAGVQNVTANISRIAGTNGAQANNADSWLQKVMKGDSTAGQQAQMALKGIGLIGALIHHSQPTAGQLRSSLASPYNKFTPGQQATFNAWAYAPPKVYSPPVYAQKRGGSVGGLSCLNYADGGAIPGATPGPQTMGMNPGPIGQPSGPPMGQGVPPMNPMQAFAQSHPNFDASAPHPMFAQNHPNFMQANFPQQGLGGGGLGVLGPARNFMGGSPQTGGGINPGATGGMQTGFNGGINPGSGMASPGGGPGPLIGSGPPPMAAFADGGMVDPSQGDPSQGGAPFMGYVQGDQPGQSDLVPIRVSPGEYVFDADSVAALGDGNNAAGAALLDRLREKLREAKRAAPANDIPPPLALLAQQGGGQQGGPQGTN